MKYPEFLKEGDEIRIISPASYVKEEYIDGAKERLESWGYKVSEGMFTRKRIEGDYAGTEQERYTDLQQALDDPEVKAILCSRGGYGLIQIIDRIDFSRFLKNPKWLIGFSDITILHQALYNQDFASIHSSMSKSLTELSDESETLNLMKGVLKGDIPTYKVVANEKNRVGRAKGSLVGGNLAVFMGMRGTKYDIDFDKNILFIEDIGEKAYRIDRMLHNLKISGAFSKISGLIVGQFTDIEHEEGEDVYQMVADAVADYDFPVSFGLSSGHIDENFPLLMGANIILDVTEEESEISFQTSFWSKAKQIFK